MNEYLFKCKKINSPNLTIHAETYDKAIKELINQHFVVFLRCK